MIYNFVRRSLLGFFPTRASPITADRDSGNYFKLGSQYYIAARAATFAACFPVAGNLFHHAVEMCLKGDLVLDVSRSSLKAYGHTLRALWAAYKEKHRTVDLSPHDPTIRALHKFEKIRYPDAITDKGMVGTIAIAPPATPVSMRSADGWMPPGYHLVVNEIDHLVRVIFTTTSRNPDFYFGVLGLEAQNILHRDNPAFPGA